MPQGLIRLLNSSKFWTAVGALVVAIFASLNLDPTKAATIVSSVSGLAIAVIAATGYEDGQEKSSALTTDPVAPAAASPLDAVSSTAKLLLLLFIPAMLLSAGCQYLTPPSQADSTADRATYDAIGPDYSREFHADPTLTADQIARRERTLETWQLRVGATVTTQPAAVGN